MTHVGELLQLALAGVFSGSLWPGAAMDKATPPYGVFNYYGPVKWYTAAKDGNQNCTVQLDIYAKTTDQCEALADTVVAAMETHDVNASPSMFTATNETRTMMGVDPDTQLRRLMLTFSFWYRPGGIPLLDPTTIAGLVAWFPFGKGLVLDANGGVALWQDYSGNGNHLVQPTLGLRPLRQSDGSVKFDGVDDYLKTAAFNYNQPETIYLLFKQNSFLSIDYIFDGFVTNNGGVRQSGASPTLALSVANTDYIFSAALAVGAYGALCAIINGAGSLLRVNNNSVAGNVLVGNNMGGFTLGAVGSGAPRQSDIQVKEALLFNTAHDATTQQRVIDYLNSL